MTTNSTRLELITFFIAMMIVFHFSVATTIFAASSPVCTIRIGNGTSLPEAIVYDPANKMMYVDTEYGLAVINSSNKMVGKIQILPPHNLINHIIYDPTNNMIYAADGYHNMVSIIDPSTSHVEGNITVQKPYAITYNPANNMIYVATDNESLFATKPPMAN